MSKADDKATGEAAAGAATAAAAGASAATDAKPDPASKKAPAPAKEADKSAAADVKVVPAAESRFSASAEFGSPLTNYVPVSGTPAAHLLRPEYWANIKALKPRVRIWIEEEAGAYVGELYVLRVGQGWAAVCWLPGYPMQLPGATTDTKVPAGYRIEWRGHIVKHRVIREKDARELKQGLETMADAEIWLRDYIRALAA